MASRHSPTSGRQRVAHRWREQDGVGYSGKSHAARQVTHDGTKKEADHEARALSPPTRALAIETLHESHKGARPTFVQTSVRKRARGAQMDGWHRDHRIVAC